MGLNLATFETNWRVALTRLSHDDYAATRCCRKKSHDCEEHWCIHCGAKIVLHSLTNGGHHQGCPTRSARATLWGWLTGEES